MKQISILGCGWLGLPLAEELIKSGFKINGSTTTESKISVLKKASITPFLIELKEDEITGDIENFLSNSSILIIDIPPKLRGNGTENFVKKITTLLRFIENSTIKKVLFVSSISVYANTNQLVTVNTKPNPETESGKQLLETEQLLQNNINLEITTLRLAGLVGKDRHPVHSLSKKTNVAMPNAPINLINQKDCIEIILKIINNGIWNKTFNAVADYHPTKKEYYTQKAIELNLKAPEFDELDLSIGKTVLGTFPEHTYEKL